MMSVRMRNENMDGHAGGRCRWLAWLSAALTTVVAATAVAATETDARRTAADAIEALKTGEYADALKGLREAEVMLPDMPQLVYDQAIAEYRLGNYEKARELFNRALTTRDLDIEERIKFNLGNCAYSEALERLSDLSGAIEKAELAISHYRDALALDPEDTDARANIETAHLLIKDLLDKKKKEEEEKQKQQQQNPSSQPSQGQQGEQPDQPDPQQGDQQQQQQPQEGQDEQDQQQEQQSPPGQDQEEKQDQPQEQQPPQASPEEQQQGDEEKQQPPGQAREQETRKMSAEEADRLLQAVRDKERERREELRRRVTGKLPPVRRDW